MLKLMGKNVYNFVHKNFVYLKTVMRQGKTHYYLLGYRNYGKCLKILNTFLFLFSTKMLNGYQGWNYQTTCQNSKQERP